MASPAFAPAAVRRLAVIRLQLSNFRCYGSLRLDVDQRPVVLTGPNGAGKTNLLEALSFLVPGRGLRRARLGDASRHKNADQPAPLLPWAVAAVVETAAGALDVGTGYAPVVEADGETRAARRTVRIDGSDASGQAALGEHLSAMWLTPDMDRLFSDGAGARRRFLDRLVFGFDPAHSGRLTAYDRALRERTRQLRDGGPGGAPVDSAWLDAVEETIAGRGIAIAAARADLVRRLDVACGAGIGPFPAARMALPGAVEDWLSDMPALEAEDRFRAGLAASRPRDRDAGGAQLGPHRADLVVTHRERGVPAAGCSTGEQKALLISIVLSAARLQTLERGQAPLLLMDEVGAHLDAPRRAALFDEIIAMGTQAWMTGTEHDQFAPLGDAAQFFEVETAHLTRADAPLAAS